MELSSTNVRNSISSKTSKARFYQTSTPHKIMKQTNPSVLNPCTNVLLGWCGMWVTQLCSTCTKLKMVKGPVKLVEVNANPCMNADILGLSGNLSFLCKMEALNEHSRRADELLVTACKLQTSLIPWFGDELAVCIRSSSFMVVIGAEMSKTWLSFTAIIHLS